MGDVGGVGVRGGGRRGGGRRGGGRRGLVLRYFGFQVFHLVVEIDPLVPQDPHCILEFTCFCERVVALK